MGKINYVLLSSNPTYNELFEELRLMSNASWTLITDKDKLKTAFLETKKIKIIFIPHWSHKIPEEIFKNYICILFHMTDLPFGRGGSPLQNLIKLGFKQTKISALRVVKEIDAGPIYLKRKLDLNGSAKEIFIRTSKIVKKMIEDIIQKKIRPKEQTGEPTFFMRRTPNQSSIQGIKNLNELYDQIRMLDCDGYPRAFLEIENFRIEFHNAILNNEKYLSANVKVFKK